MAPDLSKVKQCPACGSENIKYIEEDDQIVCNDCGEVFSELPPEKEKDYEEASDVI